MLRRQAMTNTMGSLDEPVKNDLESHIELAQVAEFVLACEGTYDEQLNQRVARLCTADFVSRNGNSLELPTRKKASSAFCPVASRSASRACIAANIEDFDWMQRTG